MPIPRKLRCDLGVLITAQASWVPAVSVLWVGFQQVWNHEDASKPEIQQNAPVKMKGYKIVNHEVLMSEFCQKVIVPVEYGPPSNRKFKLKYDDVQEVLKYRPDT